MCGGNNIVVVLNQSGRQSSPVESFFTKCKLLNQLVSDETFEMQCKLISIVNYQKKEGKKEYLRVLFERLTLVVKVWIQYEVRTSTNFYFKNSIPKIKLNIIFYLKESK